MNDSRAKSGRDPSGKDSDDQGKPKKAGLGITPREVNYSDWYNDIVLKAELADYSPVRGCMVVRPYGWAIWEAIRGEMDRMFRETGHQNAQFPLFIPVSFLAREAAHVEGFAKECAVVTHSRLKNIDGELRVDPASELEEPLIVRPTSETIINAMYAKWIQSYRDLPVLINQWCNVVRWEMRTRMFLRTTEFFWQEGHTVHETADEAMEEVLRMLGIYRTIAQDYMAMPVLTGRKSPAERFAGADETFAMEALMQDKKALQAGTSHFLGQNFAKAFDVKFQGRDGKEHFGWQTSWGSSTRLIGGLIMTHSDNQGLVLPPRIAPYQVVIVPIHRTDEDRAQVDAYVDGIVRDLKERGVRVKVDDRPQLKPGFKYNEWELRGVPLRMEAGPRDVQNQKVVLARRTGGDKLIVERGGLGATVVGLLDEIQKTLFETARKFRDANIRKATTFEQLIETLERDGGFVLAPWDGDAAVEARVKEVTSATIRCLREEDQGERCKSIGTENETGQWAMFAKAY